MTQQADKPCECGSWYHNDGKCNKCGKAVDIPKSFYDGLPTLERFKLSKGAGWDKKKHKAI
jgi:hypothetical protein